MSKEYIERGALRQAAIDAPWRDSQDEDVFYDMLDSIPAADVVEADELKSFAEDVVYQFGYHINYKGRLHLSTGGLSTLEWAFGILEWEDPKPYPEGECEWEGCHEYASCGTPTPNGYKCVCSKHYMAIKAQKEGADDV